MKMFKTFTILSLAFCSAVGLSACGGTENAEKAEDIEINKEDSVTHYLKFIEQGAEILRMVVLENETYDDLLPYFPILTEVPGYIKYWEGDYTYTNYSKDNQFKVYDVDDLIIEIYDHIKKAN